MKLLFLLLLFPLFIHAETFEWPASKPNVILTNTTYGRPLTGKDTVKLQKGNYNYPRLEQITGGGAYFTLDCRYAIFIKTDMQWGQGIAYACSWVKIYGATVLERPEPLLKFTGNNIRYPSYIWFDSCTTIKSSLCSIDYSGGKPYGGDTSNMVHHWKITKPNIKGSYKDLPYWACISFGSPFAVLDNSYHRDIEIAYGRFDSLNCKNGPSNFIQATQCMNISIHDNVFSNMGTVADPSGHISNISLTLCRPFIYNNIFGPNNWADDIRMVGGELKGLNGYTGPGRVYNNISYNKRKYAFIECRYFEPAIPSVVAPYINDVAYAEVWNNMLYRPAVGGSFSFYSQSAFIMDWYRRDGSFLKNNVLIGISDTVWNEKYIGTLGLALWEARTAKHDTAANRLFRFSQGVIEDAVRYIPVKDGPLHNTGVPVPSWLTKDFWGNPRTVGSGVDIGPVERQSDVPPPPVKRLVKSVLILYYDDNTIEVKEQ